MVGMPQLSGAGGGGGGDPELCATDEMIPFKDEGDPQKEKIFAEISHPEEEGDLADIKSSLVNESEIIPASNGHEVSGLLPEHQEAWRVPGKSGARGRKGRWRAALATVLRKSLVCRKVDEPLVGVHPLCMCAWELEGCAGKLIPSGSVWGSVGKPLVCEQKKLALTLNVWPSYFSVTLSG